MNETRGDSDRRSDERFVVSLRVDYEDADDLVSDYTENLSTGGACIASGRDLPVDSEVRLVLSFPGLIEPIRIRAFVRWTKVDPDPMLGVEFADATTRDELAALIERIKARDPALVLRTLRVLVVEDNPHVAELLRHAFDRRSLGAQLAVDCKLASDGRVALELLKRHRFDAMIVDVYLPVIDGPKLITVVRQELDYRVPIIAVSAGGEPAHRAAMAAGADMFMEKPMRLRGVIETMRSIMKLDVPA